MTAFIQSLVVVVSFSFLVACGKSTPPAEPAAPAAATSPTAPTGDHAGPGVVPGSHEDWCGEHAVPESQCSRCNPKLIAAFKATGDWCAEHALPESQCLLCHPDLKIVRPPKGAP
ncbi:MAG TPA: hypothetical protein PK095_23155 [Myxococcota bacterium]|nr:hypothetical protein [Myxococcota bacterium]